jgi:hypothetical protein
MPGDPKECREHAKECWRLSMSARSVEVAEHFEGLAKTWMQLAVELERTQLLLDEWPELFPKNVVRRSRK